MSRLVNATFINGYDRLVVPDALREVTHTLVIKRLPGSLHLIVC
jgi:hypothetical protein